MAKLGAVPLAGQSVFWDRIQHASHASAAPCLSFSEGWSHERATRRRRGYQSWRSLGAGADLRWVLLRPRGSWLSGGAAEWLKTQWKQRKLNRHIQLTISGCLGPCDVANVVAILTPRDCIWLGGVSQQEQYQTIFDWAVAAAESGAVEPLPPSLQAHVFERFSAPVPAGCDAAAALDG